MRSATCTQSWASGWLATSPAEGQKAIGQESEWPSLIIPRDLPTPSADRDAVVRCQVHEAATSRVLGTIANFGCEMPTLTDFLSNMPTKRTSARVEDQDFVAAVVG